MFCTNHINMPSLLSFLMVFQNENLEINMLKINTMTKMLNENSVLHCTFNIQSQGRCGSR